jgi:phosphoribosylanthranilate isomerase
MRVKLKICGMTRFEDARIAANLGVDALGFIFYPKSPRFVSAEQAASIISKLPPFISKVGVFVDQDLETVIAIARAAGIDTVQLHGSESPAYCESIPFPVIKAFSIRPDSDLSRLSSYNVAGFLLDTWSAEMKGGTGNTFDWSLAIRACAMYKSIILAGGLGPTNIAEALDVVKPFAVDVNSGVEISPGVKNPHKMRDVMSVVKNWKDSGMQGY